MFDRSKMLNLRMREKLDSGGAIDISQRPRTAEGSYILDRFVEDTDYCDAGTESWIWSIGRNRATGQILASTDSRYYENPQFECLFLR